MRPMTVYILYHQVIDKYIFTILPHKLNNNAANKINILECNLKISLKLIKNHTKSYKFRPVPCECRIKIITRLTFSDAHCMWGTGYLSIPYRIINTIIKRNKDKLPIRQCSLHHLLITLIPTNWFSKSHQILIQNYATDKKKITM